MRATIYYRWDSESDPHNPGWVAKWSRGRGWQPFVVDLKITAPDDMVRRWARETARVDSAEPLTDRQALGAHVVGCP
jgi:hypothetical protein